MIDQLGGPLGVAALAIIALQAMDHMDELPAGLRIDRY